MKGTLFAISGLVLLLLFVLAASFPLTAQAQSPLGTAPATPANASITSDSAQGILDEANRAANYADRAVSSVNTMLSFIQGAAIIIGAVGAVTGILLATNAFSTIRGYSAELDKARSELEQMRVQLQTQADEMRSQASNAVRALTLLQLGEQQLEEKNMKSALRTYLEAYALDPANRATNYFLGHIYTQEGNLDKGIEHLEHALAEGGAYPPAEAALAYALRLKADQMADANQRRLGYAEAERLFLRALTDDLAVRDINGESVYAVLGGLYKKQGRTQDAINAYQSAERVTPQNSYPVVNLAMLNFKEGNNEAAELYFKRSAVISERTLDGNPFDHWARFDLTIALLVLGRLDEAQRNISIALHQLRSTGPLGIFLRDLQGLKFAPQPPDHVDDMIQQVERRIAELRANEES